VRPARRARNVYIETRCHQFHTLFQYTHCCGRVPKDAHRDPNIIHFYTQGTQRIARSLPQETHQKKTRACKYIFLIMINSLRTNACGNTRNIALQLATQQSEQCCATSCTILLPVLLHLYGLLILHTMIDVTPDITSFSILN